MKFFVLSQLIAISVASSPAHAQSLRGSGSSNPTGPHGSTTRHLSDTWVPLKKQSQATTEIRSRWFSEESGGSSGRQNWPIAGIKCTGNYCDNKQLVTVNYGNENAVQFSNYWSHWFSEEHGGSSLCPRDMVVNKIQCRGDYCDDPRLSCGRMEAGYRVDRNDLTYTGFFSEEHGERNCSDGYYVVGVQCRGDYCDDVQLTCAKVYKDERYSVAGKWVPLYEVVGEITHTLRHGTSKTLFWE